MPEPKPFALTTDAVDDHQFFDPRYTCDLDNSSPELRWSDPPPETQGFALITEDHDAPSGVFTHWIVYQVPGSVRHLPAGVPTQESLPNGIRQGINSYGKLGYAVPPAGDRVHRYTFRLYALRELPTVPARATREQLLAAIEPHVIARAELAARYQRVLQRTA